PWRAQAMSGRVDSIINELRHSPITLSACALLLQRLSRDAALIEEGLARDESEDAAWAAGAFRGQCTQLHEDLLAAAPWVTIAPAPEGFWRQGDREHAARLGRLREQLRALETTATLASVANFQRTLIPEIDAVLAPAAGSNAEERTWLVSMRDALLRGAVQAGERLAELDAIAEQCQSLNQMDFQFLYDKSRDQLAIGYNVSDHRRDPSYYDLLASEARIGIFVGVALEQLPQDSWFALGRRLTSAGGRPALLSWSGSMFEYLMPLLIMPTYEETLLDQTYHAVVQYQREYGKQHNVPWGISESGYNTTDAALNYQYRAFGVPGLGYKRGLADDLVIAPYATVMSLMVAPEEAAANMVAMEGMGFTGRYGFYEAVDYTPSRVPSGQNHAIVRSFMAHHQGMSFLSLAYTMLDAPMQRRFLADPLLRANTLLLHERVPRTAPAYPQSAEMEQSQRSQGAEESNVRSFGSATTPVPEVHLLSNGHLHVAVTTAGGGFCKWNDLGLTRWNPDPTRDNWGSFCYIRDLDSGEYWSATYQPTLRKPEQYSASFLQGRAEFRRLDSDIDTRLDIAISPEADIELRRLTISNRSGRRRRIEITSYAEVTLAPRGADSAHPAFSNLFVQTQILPAQQAILCTRRPRSAAERPPYLLHLMSVQGKTAGDATYETDRAKFIGRGRSTTTPAALESGARLSGSEGAVLDPIIAIRRVIVLEEDASAQIDYVTGIAETREAAVAMIDRHRDPRLGDRVFEMAWTHSQVVLRHLGASEAEAQLFGRLLSSVLYPNRLRRADAAILARNRRGQSALWGYGISGDLPIVLLRIGDTSKMELVRQLMQAHAYWRMKGLAVDLVIWNEDHSGYRQHLNDEIMGLIAAGPEAHALDRPGGIFVRRLEQISEDDKILFQTVASAIITDTNGTLAEQIGRRPRPATQIPLLETTPRRETMAGQAPAAARQLEFFNSLGGMTPDGREYIITTDRAHPTPAPWCNIIANRHIGTVISESGSAYTFVENAHEFRLTPWANDPISDPTGEAFYLRDEETGDVWSPSSSPSRSRGSYATRHGFGYSVFECVHEGIRSELWIYVALDAPVKFAVLKIDNQSGRPRTLSATGYWEWVLGDLRSKSLMHIVTE
ncbi:MAG TPA: glucoamylase family protein, partial [Phycisphaerae bacterium]|nr:glucoamylase family protein [Phycisphaerae bacterium]